MAGPTPHGAAGRRAHLSRPARWAWAALGLVCVALGGVGAVVPGLPTTVFVIAAAACFARSSPRLERRLLGLPGVGAMVRDHRAGLGMPRRAKAGAVAMIALATAASVGFVLDGWPARAAVLVAAVVGIVVVCWRVPTREAVLAARRAGT